MVAGCANKCIKYILFCFNFLFCLGGALVLSLALWIRLDNTFSQYLEKIVKEYSGTTLHISDYYLALYVVCGLGGLLFLTGFLGCCGAACESTCLLGLFFVVLLLLFIAELAVGVYIMIKRDDFRHDVARSLTDTLIPKYSESEEVKQQVDRIQTNLKCCGASGCEDWPIHAIPASCSCPATGCVDRIYDELKDKVNIIAGVAVGIFAIEVIGMIFALMLCCSLRRTASDYY